MLTLEVYECLLSCLLSTATAHLANLEPPEGRGLSTACAALPPVPYYSVISTIARFPAGYLDLSRLLAAVTTCTLYKSVPAGRQTILTILLYCYLQHLALDWISESREKCECCWGGAGERGGGRVGVCRGEGGCHA